MESLLEGVDYQQGGVTIRGCGISKVESLLEGVDYQQGGVTIRGCGLSAGWSHH